MFCVIHVIYDAVLTKIKTNFVRLFGPVNDEKRLKKAIYEADLDGKLLGKDLLIQLSKF
jgi:hypothetical protein